METTETYRAIGELVGAGVLAILSYLTKSLISSLKEKYTESAKRHDENDRNIAALDRACADRRAEIERDLAAHKLHVAENYSTKNDLGNAIQQFTKSTDAVFERLGRIEDKIDKKADKSPVHG